MRRRSFEIERNLLRERDPLRYLNATEFDGISPLVDPKDDVDKELHEYSAASEWKKSAKLQRIVDAGTIERGDDPPDFFFMSAHGRLSLEVTELLNANFRSKQKRMFKRGTKYNAHSGAGFFDAQWTIDEFELRISTLIASKSNKYQEKPTFDYLLIFSNEYWLIEEDVKTWLPKCDFPVTSAFKHVHLMLGYHTRTKSHPIFVIK